MSTLNNTLGEVFKEVQMVRALIQPNQHSRKKGEQTLCSQRNRVGDTETPYAIQELSPGERVCPCLHLCYSSLSLAGTPVHGSMLTANNYL